MRGVILLKDAAADFNKMAQAYLKEKGYKLGITDGLRSYETQVQTMIDKPEKAATPGTSDHGTGNGKTKALFYLCRSQHHKLIYKEKT